LCGCGGNVGEGGINQPTFNQNTHNRPKDRKVIPDPIDDRKFQE